MAQQWEIARLYYASADPDRNVEGSGIIQYSHDSEEWLGQGEDWKAIRTMCDQQWELVTVNSHEAANAYEMYFKRPIEGNT